MKNTLRHSLVLAAVAAMISLSTGTVSAQDSERAEQRRQEQMTRYREMMDVKSDADWKEKIEPLVAKVQTAQRAATSLRGFGGFGGGRGGGGGGGGQGGQGGNRNPFGQPSPEFEALQKAITDKAPADEIKDKLAKYREARKAKEDALEKAQDELRKALTPKQEAGAAVAGLLK